jgi:hypothetical protein
MGLPAIKSGAGSCWQKSNEKIIKVNESSGAGMFQGFFMPSDSGKQSVAV